jgi:hypothetical protein
MWHNEKKNEYGQPNYNIKKTFTTKSHELYVWYSGILQDTMEQFKNILRVIKIF